MQPIFRICSVPILILLSTILTNAQTPEAKNKIIIYNVKVIDGTGGPVKANAVKIQGSKIVEIGNFTPTPGETQIDGKGMVLAPGFIDTHSHHFGDMKSNPSALPAVSQGITTIVMGQDGDGYTMDKLSTMMNQNAVAINVATYTGHSTLREMVMGENELHRNATQDEVEKMKSILNTEMQKGSFGLSTGLEYESAFYSNKDEVIQLAKVLTAFNGRYMSHVRSEDVHLNEAIDEIIEIGKVAKIPVQISHIKIAKKSDWGTAPLLLDKLEKVRSEGIDITADVYPYTFWNSTLRVLFPDKKFTSLASAQFAVDQLFDANESVLVKFAANPSYKGKTIAQIAKERNETPAKTLIQLVSMAASFKANNPNYEGSVEAIAGKSMSESDVIDFLKWPYANICSDGRGGGHPRGYGAFTRFIGRYVRDQKLMSLETAIYKMTGLSAAHLGIKNRGTIAVGNYADLVLLNPNTVIDNADIKNSQLISTGIEMVWVNGKLIYNQQKVTGNLPGVLIKR